MRTAACLLVLSSLVGCSSSSAGSGEDGKDSAVDANAEATGETTGGDSAVEEGRDAGADAVRDVADARDGGTDAVADSTAEDASPDTAAAETAPIDAGGGCNSVDLPAPAIEKYIAETPPTPLGGTIGDGTYDMTEFDVFTGPGGTTSSTPGKLKIRFVVTGTTLQDASDIFGPEHHTATLVTAGTSFALKILCGPNDFETGLTYSVTPEGFTLLDHFGGSDRAFVFVKR